MGYVTFGWYTAMYNGAVIPDEQSFNAAATEADAYIDNLTMGRITEAADAVKKAVCAVAEVIYMQSHDEDSTVTSESVGNHSKGFAKTSRSPADREAEKLRKASLYLSRTGLMYRGMH